MKLTRRDMFLAGIATATLPRLAAAEAPPATLRAGASSFQLLAEDYGKTALRSFDGAMQGAQIRVAQGDRVRRRLVNELDQPTSIHWHGVRIANAMDGVAGLTQAAVEPGASFDYDFAVPDAGTFWYHAHNRSFEQVARGLYGALIVEEPDPIDIDRDEVLILDDWRIDPETAQLAGDFGALHDLSHGGRIGNYVTTNARPGLTLKVRRHERLRLRLINAANARVFQLQLAGLAAWVVALDGMPLAVPRPLGEAILMGPAQRVDLIADVTAESGETAYIVRVDGADGSAQVAFEIGEGGARQGRNAPQPLPPNAVPVPDLATARAVELRMEGAAMGGMGSAITGGRMTTMQDLAAVGRFWAFNGAIGTLDGPPLAELSRGETVRLTIANDTVFPHAMHLHGMHFLEVEADGSLGAFRDTTLVLRGERREIAFVADNPGDWLLHCHMLDHAASGMTTRIRIA